MKQILFVLKEDQIAFWKYSRGSLARGTLNGNRWNDFTSSYWDEWSEANQAGDSVDAILLSDKPNGFCALPEEPIAVCLPLTPYSFCSSSLYFILSFA